MELQEVVSRILADVTALTTGLRIITVDDQPSSNAFRLLPGFLSTPVRRLSIPPSSQAEVEQFTTDLNSLSLHGDDSAYQLSCANAGCREPGVKACSGCGLVKYCSKKCQDTHWESHRNTACSECPLVKSWLPIWETENRQPSFERDAYSDEVSELESADGMWNGSPAYDILNLKQNEGVAYPRDLDILFAACGDLSSMITTINALTPTYSGRCSVMLNDIDDFVVVRNALLMLCAFYMDPNEAADTMLHLWYSARLRPATIRLLQSKIKPAIDDVCRKIAKKYPTRSSGNIMTKTIEYEGTKLKLRLRKSHWKNLEQILRFDLEPEKAHLQRDNAMKSDIHLDLRHAFWLRQKSTRRVADAHFMETGILAPFSEDVQQYTVPNSVLHVGGDAWIYTNGSLPPESWPISMIKSAIEKTSLPENDLYGGTAVHVHNTLCKFCEQIRRLYVTFEISNLDVSALPKFIAGRDFDRIDVSNVMDYHFPDLLGLPHFLRRSHRNPHATFIAHFDKTIHSALANESINASQAYQMIARIKALCLLNEDLPTKDGVVKIEEFTHLDRLKTLFAEHAYADGEVLFQLLDDELSISGYAYMRGLQMKDTNTILPEWPSRLKTDPLEEVQEAREEYLQMERYHFENVWERYVEWRVASAEDIEAGFGWIDEIIADMRRSAFPGEETPDHESTAGSQSMVSAGEESEDDWVHDETS